MMLKKLPILLGALFCVLTFALATSGFGHRFSTASEAGAEIYAVAYGLSASDLCGGSGEHGAGKDCDACRLLTTFHFPDRETGHVRLIPAPTAATAVAFGGRLSSLTRNTARPARAPPVA